MKTISVETTIHGRALVQDPSEPSTPLRLLVGFHGYAQSAEDMLSELARIPGHERWTLLSVQGLHRFYSRRYETVVASWMTRQDRDLAIADNMRYVDRVMESVVGADDDPTVVFVGFSQGAAMAYRAGVLGRYCARQVVSIGGDVPPDIRSVPSSRYPAILLARGEDDALYTAEKAKEDESFLRSLGVTLDIIPYRGGHEWTDELRARIGETLTSF
ncbi:MAG TPA: phospholipase [Terriglobia bacterium]|nr:phospholipase [Terriglobia bacterium]